MQGGNISRAWSRAWLCDHGIKLIAAIAVVRIGSPVVRHPLGGCRYIVTASLEPADCEQLWFRFETVHILHVSMSIGAAMSFVESKLTSMPRRPCVCSSKPFRSCFSYALLSFPSVPLNPHLPLNIRSTEHQPARYQPPTLTTAASLSDTRYQTPSGDSL